MDNADSMLTIRPTVIDVDLDAIVSNFHLIEKQVAPSLVMPILKSNAYGHGLVHVARCLEKAGAKRFCLAYLEEAVELRKAGIEIPLLALGAISYDQIKDFILNDVEMTASSIEKVAHINSVAEKLGKTANIQLKIDTGMERIGVHYYSAEKFLEACLNYKMCNIVGIFSHFATDEEEDLEYAKLQLERFLECTSFFEKHSLPMPLRHMANSAAILRMPEAYLDGVRPGLILYGISPASYIENLQDMKRTWTLRSKVSYFKVVKAGAGVSYDHIYKTPCDTRVVTIPIGYGDGYPRRLSNKGSVLIHGKRYPIIGKVCMDQMMVNIGPDGEAYNGDEVVLVGKQGDEEIKVEDIAEIVGTDIRDILCATNLRIPRCYHYNGHTFVD